MLTTKISGQVSLWLIMLTTTSALTTRNNTFVIEVGKSPQDTGFNITFASEEFYKLFTCLTSESTVSCLIRPVNTSGVQQAVVTVSYRDNSSQDTTRPFSCFFDRSGSNLSCDRVHLELPSISFPVGIRDQAPCDCMCSSRWNLRLPFSLYLDDALCQVSRERCSGTSIGGGNLDVVETIGSPESPSVPLTGYFDCEVVIVSADSSRPSQLGIILSLSVGIPFSVIFAIIIFHVLKSRGRQKGCRSIENNVTSPCHGQADACNRKNNIVFDTDLTGKPPSILCKGMIPSLPSAKCEINQHGYFTDKREEVDKTTLCFTQSLSSPCNISGLERKTRNSISLSSKQLELSVKSLPGSIVSSYVSAVYRSSPKPAMTDKELT